ncbi:hypothetical protein Q8791_22955 [Nocardiopsis sp. CT-R113]|uniref:Uncharacterized protein n=1 Tax=Nocardiopsis codii TaxID=3065942 RepID=A0ABU7KCX0_9ACTN|nr:hypothetical protein [Nocardiopsis sp. CT-R113]MEE2040080.1 hypothetical protein [Nocardiopsis sp. CT-R113]
MSDDEVRQLLVHPVLWPHLTDWLNSRGLDITQLSAAGEDLATYTVSPRTLGTAVCRSSFCSRSGVNAAGFCCHGCAAHSRFGRELLHGPWCDDANPGVENAPTSRENRATQKDIP